MSMHELIKQLFENHGTLVVVLLCLVEITPIKINPLSWICKWIGARVNGELKKEINALRLGLIEARGDLNEVKQDVEQMKVDAMRWDILTFANNCHCGKRHTKEEWNHVISQCQEYEDYIERKQISNGVIVEETKYLRELYQGIIRDNNFL